MPRDTPFETLFRNSNHWLHHHLGDLWRDAGTATVESHPAAARRAYEWSNYYFLLHNKAWSENLPASRFDSDGGAPVPAWVEALLNGDWQTAKSALGGAGHSPAFQPAALVLSRARVEHDPSDTPA